MKLKETYATEVEISDAGYLLITQEDESADCSSVFVALSREQARLIAQEIMRLDADDAFWTGAQ